MTKTEDKLIARLAAASADYPRVGYEGKRECNAARALAAKGLVKMVADTSVSYRRMGSGKNLYHGRDMTPMGYVVAI
jgi:hypothetical protein